MTELAPPIQSADNYVFYRAVSSLTQSPDLSAKVGSVFGEGSVAQTYTDMEAWLKGAVDASLVTGTHFAEINAVTGIEEAAFVATGGDEDHPTGAIPAVEKPSAFDDEGSIDDPTGVLLEDDKYPLDLRPSEIRGPVAHVALVALCAAAKEDEAAQDLWERMDLSAPSRMLHEAALADSRLVSRSAAVLLRLF